jgi:tetratricopeptide (TPR) repeat protein
MVRVWNKPGVWAIAAFWPILAAAVPAAQNGSFDDLARRASDAIETRPAEAAALYQRALAMRPGWAEGWMYRGAALFELGRFREARDALRKCAALAPGKGTTVAFIGMAEYELGDYAQALADILKGESIGLADRPAFVAQVRYRGALIYLRSGNFPQALEQLRPLARNGIQTPEAVEALGLSVLNLHFLPATLPPERHALVELAGRAAWAYLAERPEESGPLFEQLGSQFPDEPGVHYMKGVFLIDHDPAAAEQEFRKELRIAPSHVLARVQLALLLSKDGDADSAVRLAGEAVELDPADALCQVTLGRALLDAGRTAEAIAALEKGEKLAPQAARVHFYLAQAYRRAGRDADARKENAVWDRLHAQQEPVELNAGQKP